MFLEARKEEVGMWRQGSRIAAKLTLAAMLLHPRVAKAEGLNPVFLSPRERLAHENPALLASEEEQIKAGLELGPKHAGVNGILILRSENKYFPVIRIEDKLWALDNEKGTYSAYQVENILSAGTAWETALKKFKAGAVIDLGLGRGFTGGGKLGAIWSPSKHFDFSGLLGSQEQELGVHWNVRTKTTLSALLGNETVRAEVEHTLKDLTLKFKGGYGWGGGVKWEAGVGGRRWEANLGWGPETGGGGKSAGYAGFKYKFPLARSQTSPRRARR